MISIINQINSNRNNNSNRILSQANPSLGTPFSPKLKLQALDKDEFVSFKGAPVELKIGMEMVANAVKNGSKQFSQDIIGPRTINNFEKLKLNARQISSNDFLVEIAYGGENGSGSISLGKWSKSNIQNIKRLCEDEEKYNSIVKKLDNASYDINTDKDISII